MRAYEIMSLIGGEGSASSSVITALQTAFTSIASDLGNVIVTIAPIALGIVGAGMVLLFGVKWFKKLTNKA